MWCKYLLSTETINNLYFTFDPTVCSAWVAWASWWPGGHAGEGGDTVWDAAGGGHGTSGVRTEPSHGGAGAEHQITTAESTRCNKGLSTSRSKNYFLLPQILISWIFCELQKLSMTDFVFSFRIWRGLRVKWRPCMCLWSRFKPLSRLLNWLDWI